MGTLNRTGKIQKPFQDKNRKKAVTQEKNGKKTTWTPLERSRAMPEACPCLTLRFGLKWRLAAKLVTERRYRAQRCPIPDPTKHFAAKIIFQRTFLS